jgi:hypothetical protein
MLRFNNLHFNEMKSSRLGRVCLFEQGLSRILFLCGNKSSSRMRTRLLMTAAAMLLGMVSYSQEIPYYPGQGLNQGSIPYSGYPGSQTGQGNQINCSDPLMAASTQCGGGGGGGFYGGAFPGIQSNSQIPGMGQVPTYTDDQGRLTSRDRSTMIPLPPEPLTEFQKFTSSTTGMVLPIFGANLFQTVPSTFAPLDNAPVPADYVIGPDDMVRLRVWGQVNFNADLRVDRTGNIFVPQVGAVAVAGRRFGDLDQILRGPGQDLSQLQPLGSVGPNPRDPDLRDRRSAQAGHVYSQFTHHAGQRIVCQRGPFGAGIDAAHRVKARRHRGGLIRSVQSPDRRG